MQAIARKPAVSKKPQLRFKSFQDDWSAQTLSKYVSIQSGYAFSSTLFSESGLKLVTPKNFTKTGLGSFTSSNSKCTTEEVGDRFVCNPGDLLMLLTDLTPSCELLGMPLLLTESDGQVLLNQRVIRLESDDALVNRRFLANYFLTDDFHKRIKETSSGTTVRHSSNAIVLGTRLHFPTLPEQTKIAGFLSAVDGKIQQLTRKKALLEQYKKGVMQKIFSQEIRFTRADGTPSRGASATKGKAFPEWEEKRLGEIATFTKGKGISKGDIVEGGATRCIRYGELYTTYKEVITDVVSSTNVDPSELFFSMKNDVIIPSSGETQLDLATASCVMQDGIALGGDLNVIRTKADGVFLSYYMNSAKKIEIAELGQGNSVVHLYSTHLKTLPLNLPCLEEQQRIAAFLSALDGRVAAVQQQLAGAVRWKKGLLQQMFV